jgi:putative salt-induced outer membrane protein YdiY
MGWADVVTLKNGDRITGTMITIQGGTLQLKSDTAGTLSIPMAKVATFSPTKPVAVIIKGQEPIQGMLQLMPSGDWQVSTNGQVQTIAAAKVDTIMPADEYAKLVGPAPKPWQAWKGTASLGYSVQSGNQQTSNLATGLTAVRDRPAAPIFSRHWRTNFDFSSLFSHAHEDGNTVTSRTVTANLMQDYVFTEENFLFFMAQANHVSTQGLYLQQTYGGGYGRTLIKNARTRFAVTAGPTYVQEKFFTGLLTRTAEALIAETLGTQVTKQLRIDHFFQFYPDLVNRGQYRFDTSTVAAISLPHKFSANASIIDLYLSNPPAGNRGNNVTFTVGIGYSF